MKHIIGLLILGLSAGTMLHSEEFIPGNDFNEFVLTMLKSYPTDGSHRYYWPKQGGWAGNTCDLHYRDQLFAKGDPEERCYCCGLTFEVFLRAYQQYCLTKGQPFIIKDFDRQALKTFQRQWFGSDGNRKTLYNAIISNALGNGILFADAKAGDFVQFWRHSGSGHSVIFISWIRNSEQQIIGLQYWSTQGSTNGIGYHTEYFGNNSGIDQRQVYIARVGKK